MKNQEGYSKTTSVYVILKIPEETIYLGRKERKDIRRTYGLCFQVLRSTCTISGPLVKFFVTKGSSSWDLTLH